MVDKIEKTEKSEKEEADIILKVDNLGKIFGKTTILKGISFDVKKGESFGIVGVSGSGKTTMMKVLVGFLVPDVGEVLFRNREVLKSVHKYSEEAKMAIGFAPQEPSFYLELTVKENLDHFGALFGIPREERKQAIDKLLKKVDLLEAKENLAMKMSGGMRKRLGLVASTIHNPSIFVLDEPTADLDPYSRKQVMKYIKEVNKEGKTVIIASHHLDDLEEMCDRIAVVHKGKLLKVGTPDELKDIYLKDKLIELRTEKQDYEAMKKALDESKEAKVSEIKEEGKRLVVKTQDAVEALAIIMATIKKSKDELKDISIQRPSLNDVFESMMKKEGGKL